MTTSSRADLRRASRAAIKAANALLSAGPVGTTAEPLARSQTLDTARAKAKAARESKRLDKNRAYSRAYTQVLNKAYRARDAAAQASPADAASIRAARLSDETYAAARAAGQAASQAT